MPEVSIIMTVYNGRNDIIRAIQSIERQTFRNFQLIIVDDCSSDDTYKIISKHLWYSSINWLIIKNQENVGCIKSILNAYEKCNSKWVIRIDHDDEFCDNTLQTLMSNNDNYDIIYGPYVEVLPNLNKVICPNNLMECIACGVLCNTELVDNVGGYANHDAGIFCEYDLYIRMINGGAKLLAKPNVVYKYYRRANSITRNADDVQASINMLSGKWGNEWTNKIRKY